MLFLKALYEMLFPPLKIMRFINQSLTAPFSKAPFSKQTALLISGVMLVGLLTNCKSGSDSRSAETASEPATSEVTEVAEPSSKSPSKGAQRLHAELVETYGKDYESCGESVRAEAATCSAEGSAEEGAESARKENLNIQLILDVSGSMAGLVGGEDKMTVAKETLTDFVSGLPEKANLALRVYGHLGSNSEADRATSCVGTELLYDFQPLDQDKFSSVIESLNPTGWTPIAASLKQAGDDFSDYDAETNENVVYLVSDGIETCDGDPVAAAEALNQSEINTIVNVIGFDVDAESAAQLRSVAQAGGGDYIEANNRDDLNRIFNETFISAHGNYNCTFIAEHGAYNKTFIAQHGRYNCLFNKAYSEYNAISSEVYRRSNSGEIEPETRKEIIRLAKQKRDGILEPAKAERDRVVEGAKEDRDQTIEPAKEERDRILDNAEAEREAGQ